MKIRRFFSYISKKQSIAFVIMFAVSITIISHISFKETFADTITTDLIRRVESKKESEAYTALFLLRHLSLNDLEIEKLDEIKQKSQKPLLKLHILYVLAARVGFRYIDEYINSYPSGKHQSKLLHISSNKTEYITVTTPLAKLLGFYANTSDTALIKLVSGLPYADAAHRECLESIIEKIAEIHPARVKKVMKQLDVKSSPGEN